MGQIKYRMLLGMTEPYPIEIIGETETSVVLARGRRDHKQTKNMSYFDTPEEAIQWARDREEEEIIKLRAQIELAQDRIKKLTANLNKS